MNKRAIIWPIQEYLLRFDAPKYLLEDAFEKVNRIIFFKNEYNKISYSSTDETGEENVKKSAQLWNPNLNLAKEKQFSELHEWFQDCIDISARSLGFSPRFKIVHSWANRASKSEWHHPHTHPLAYMCGTFNLTSSESGQTYYDFPSSHWDRTLLGHTTYKDGRSDYDLVPYNRHFEKPEAGKLIIFPANVTHGVTVHDDEQDRFTISFDTFPERTLGRFGPNAHDLSIKILDY